MSFRSDIKQWLGPMSILGHYESEGVFIIGIN